MKKLLSIIMLLVVLSIMPANEAYACQGCGCGCDQCKTGDVPVVTIKTKTNQFKKKTKALLKPVKSYGKKYGWTVKTEVIKKTSKKYYTKVVFNCPDMHCYMDVVIRATKKNGKVTAEWWYKQDGKWYRTTSEGMKKSLAEYGYKK